MFTLEILIYIYTQEVLNGKLKFEKHNGMLKGSTEVCLINNQETTQNLHVGNLKIFTFHCFRL